MSCSFLELGAQLVGQEAQGLGGLKEVLTAPEAAAGPDRRLGADPALAYKAIEFGLGGVNRAPRFARAER